MQPYARVCRNLSWRNLDRYCSTRSELSSSAIERSSLLRGKFESSRSKIPLSLDSRLFCRLVCFESREPPLLHFRFSSLATCVLIDVDKSTRRYERFQIVHLCAQRNPRLQFVRAEGAERARSVSCKTIGKLVATR